MQSAEASRQPLSEWTHFCAVCSDTQVQLPRVGVRLESLRDAQNRIRRRLQQSDCISISHVIWLAKTCAQVRDEEQVCLAVHGRWRASHAERQRSPCIHLISITPEGHPARCFCRRHCWPRSLPERCRRHHSGGGGNRCLRMLSRRSCARSILCLFRWAEELRNTVEC